nr:GNAT family N-acetyltransferase [uncultured Pseudomonas sp.]
MTNKVSLRAFTLADHAALERWATDTRASTYMARTQPSRKVLLWQVIVVDGRGIGTIWVESSDHPAHASLGVLLGDTALMGQGIGRRAIQLTLDQLDVYHWLLAVTLNVRSTNMRAVKCYLGCGFRVCDRFVRTSDTGSYEVIRMIKDLTV